jgi:protein-disulfide isomerase
MVLLMHVRLSPQRRRELAVGAGVLVLVVAAGLAGLLIQRSRASAAGAAYSGPYAPVTWTAGGTVTMSQPGVTGPVLNVWEDFQCSICDDFEVANGGAVEELAYQGRVKVVYHLFTIFVGSQPRQANSTRAWAAARCAPAGSWVRYHDLIYAHQPAETANDGFPVSQLLTLGKQVGLTGRVFVLCVESQRYAAQIVPLSNRIIKSGIRATPTVTLNGRPVQLSTLVSAGADLSHAILADH